jgi:hypothetical protein
MGRRENPSFVRGEKLEELGELCCAKCLLVLETADWCYRLSRQLERAGPRGPPGAEAEFPRTQHPVLGAVPAGDTLAYVGIPGGALR